MPSHCATPLGRPSFPRIAIAVVAVTVITGCGTAGPSLPAGSAGTPPAPTSQPISPPPIDDATPETPATTPTVETHWDIAGTMHVARLAPHVLVLGDGRVMAVGSAVEYDNWGEVVPDESRLVEVWDPRDATWRLVESLNKPRGGSAAVSLDDGRVLVAGGMNQQGGAYSSGYIFDPATDAWTKTGLMDTARANPAAAVLPDGRVLVAGGRYSTGWGDYPWAASRSVVLAAYREPAPGDAWTGPVDDADPGPVGHALATAELFDPDSGTWTRTGSMRFARTGAEAVTLSDGRVLVWGGQDPTDDAGTWSTGELYDPGTGRFSPTPAIPEVDRDALRERGVPLADRVACHEYNYGAGLVALADGGAMLRNVHTFCADLEIVRMLRLDAGASTWRDTGEPFVTSDPEEGGAGGPWGTRHADGFSVPMPDGRVLFAGGERGRAVELYDPGSETWSPLPKMPAARESGSGVVLDDGSVLLVGSGSQTDTFLLVLGR